MALLDTARTVTTVSRHRRHVTAGALVAAAALTVAIPAPVSADEPSPGSSAAADPLSPGMLGTEADPAERHGTEARSAERQGTEAGSAERDGTAARDRRPAPEATTGNMLLRNGRFRALPDAPGAMLTVHIGLNDRGQTVGVSVDKDGNPHGFVYDGHGRFRTITIPGAPYAVPRDINDRGQVVGTHSVEGATPGPDGMVPPGFQHAFLWDRGRVTVIDPPDTAAYPNAYKVNDRGQVVGSRYLADGTQLGYLRQVDGTYVTLDPPGGAESKGLGLSDRGVAVGGYLDDGVVAGPDGLVPPGTIHGFRWDDGRYTRLDADAPGVRSTAAHGINNRGDVVGEVKDANGRIRGFLRTHGRYTLIDAPGDRSDTLPIDINNRGDILIPAPGAIEALGNGVS